MSLGRTLVGLRTAALASALVASAGLFDAACSPANVMGTTPDAGTDAGSEAGADGGAIGAACSKYAYTYCDDLNTCSSSLVAMRYGSTVVCEKMAAEACVLQLSAPDTGATPASIGACQMALSTWHCPDLLKSINPPPECANTVGPRASGSPCAVNAQCASGYCGGLKEALCGTCAATPMAGDSCVTEVCLGSLGLNCHGTPPVCTAYATAGQSCAAAECAAGLSCVSSTCQPAATGLGTACTPSPGAGCDPIQGWGCDASTNQCAQIRLAAPGQACGSTVGTQYVACTAGACPRGVCLGYPPLGAPCDLTGAACLLPARCIPTSDAGTAGTCRIAGSIQCN
jgi:hypothetical protein